MEIDKQVNMPSLIYSATIFPSPPTGISFPWCYDLWFKCKKLRKRLRVVNISHQSESCFFFCLECCRRIESDVNQ